MAQKTEDNEETYPSEEQGIDTEKSGEEEDLEMDEGEKEEEVYSKKGREKLTEEDEIEPWEEGFMEGASDKGKEGHCPVCGKPLSEDKEEIIEKEIDGETVQFCSEKCAKKGLTK
jgi:hypothetical protein